MFKFVNTVIDSVNDVIDNVKEVFDEQNDSSLLYFENKITVDEFSQKLIKELATFKHTINILNTLNIDSTKVQELDKRAFNLLINHIEFLKGNTKIEIGVIGGFSSGKSTFINSLLQKDVCPTDVQPTTSSITKFYYGHKESIKLNNKQKISKDEYQNLAKHLKGEIKNTQANFIEYAYPFEMLNSVILYDTPGFNNSQNKNDEKVTKQTLKSVDIILYLIDISKGSIGADEIKLLKEFKNKQKYCILNKADLKSEKAVLKVKEEINSYNLFEEIIEYSSSMVLEVSKEIFLEHLEYIKHNFIYKSIDFNTHIKGETVTKKSRIKTTSEYSVFVDNKKFIIKDYYQKAIKQQKVIKKLFIDLKDKKQSILEKNFDKEKELYETQSKTIMNNLLSSKSNQNANDFTNFNKDIKEFETKLKEFEQEHIESFYLAIYNCIKNAFTPYNASQEEKSYWSTPYSKIYFNKDVFSSKYRKTDFFNLLKNYLNEIKSYFSQNYNFQLDIGLEKYIEYGLKVYLKELNVIKGSGYYLNKNGQIHYFEDTNEARKFIDKFASSYYNKGLLIKDLYTFFMEYYKEPIEEHKRYLHTKTNQNTTLEQELNDIIKNFKG